MKHAVANARLFALIVGLAAPVALVGPATSLLAASLGDVGAHDPLVGLAAVLRAGAVLAGALAWSWLVACVTACVRDERAARRGAARVLDRPGSAWRPVLVRMAVAAVLGTATTAPAAGGAAAFAGAAGEADQPGRQGGAADVEVLAGLRLPDRPVGGPGVPGPPAAPVYVVRAGDSLWSITRSRLGPRAPNSVVDRGWRAVYDHNRDRIGPRPDLIHPGLKLRLPGRPDPRPAPIERTRP